MPESRERTEQRIDLCFEQRSALFPLGEFARQSEVVEEARTLAVALGDQRRLGRTLAYQANLYAQLGDYRRGIDAAESARAIAESIGDLGLRVLANYYLGWALWYAGEPRRAAEPVRAVIALVKVTPLSERFGLSGLPAMLARFHLAGVLAELGAFPDAIAAGDEGLRIAQAGGHPFSEILALYGLGYAYLRHGDFAAAARVLESGLALCRTMGIRLPCRSSRRAWAPPISGLAARPTQCRCWRKRSKRSRRCGF